MHSEWTDLLSGYLDDELDPPSRARLEAHLGRCAECRGTLEELRRVVAWAPNYAGTEPGRDLWPQVREAIDRGKVATLPDRRDRSARQFTWVHLIAAGLVMALLGGGGAWLLLRGASQPVPVAQSPAPGAERRVPRAESPGVRAVANADPQYDAAIADLEQVLSQGRSKLDTTTVRIVEESLRTIDRAIAEARAAIQRDSTNAYLSAQIAANLRRKLAILRQAARAIATES